MKENILKKLIADSNKHYLDKSIVVVDYHVLKFEEFKELLIEVYTKYVGASDTLIISSYSYWQDFTYPEWLIIFNDLRKDVETKQKGVFGFETFMKFFYQILEIDIFSVYAGSVLNIRML